MYVEQIDLLIKLITLHFVSKERVADYHNRIQSNQNLLDNLESKKNNYIVKINKLEQNKQALSSSVFVDKKTTFLGKNSAYKGILQLVFLAFFAFTLFWFLGKSFAMILGVISKDSYYLSSNMSDYITTIVALILGIILFLGPKFKADFDNKNKKKSYYQEQQSTVNKLDLSIQSYKEELNRIQNLINQAESSVKLDNDVSYATIQNTINPNITLTQELINTNPLNLGDSRIWDISYLKSLREIFATDQADTLREAKVILENRVQNKENIQEMTNSLKSAISALGNTINKNLIKIANEVKIQNQTLVKINNDINNNSRNIQSQISQTNLYLENLQSGQSDLLKSEEKTAAATREAAEELKYFNSRR